MDTIWIWGWCLLPLIFCGILAVACFWGAGRRGGCGCKRSANECGRNPPGPAAR